MYFFPTLLPVVAVVVFQRAGRREMKVTKKKPKDHRLIRFQNAKPMFDHGHYVPEMEETTKETALIVVCPGLMKKTRLPPRITRQQQQQQQQPQIKGKKTTKQD